MTTYTPPYDGRGQAAFEELDTHTQRRLLAGSHPRLEIPISKPLPNDVSYAKHLVVGVNATGKLVPATYVAPAAASGVITFTDTGQADDTVVIGSVTYTLKAAPDAAYEVDIGASAADTAANLAAAINASGTAGTTYGEDTVAHPAVRASVDGAAVTVTSVEAGANGNLIATTETSSHASFAAASLAGGLDLGGVRARYVLVYASSLGSSPATGNAQVYYSGCFNQDELVWDASFDSDAKKQAAFDGAPSPINIIVAKRS